MAADLSCQSADLAVKRAGVWLISIACHINSVSAKYVKQTTSMRWTAAGHGH